MTELTTEVLDEGERLCREATPGPFVYIESTGEIRDCEYRHIADTPEYDDRPEDMRLFAFARNHLAELLASARRELAMQQQLAQAERVKGLEQSCRDAKRATIDAYQQLAYLWHQTGSCPCGARRESPNTHSHVSGCPTAKAVELGF